MNSNHSRRQLLRIALASASVPLLLFAAGVGLLLTLGVLQRTGWLAKAATSTAVRSAAADVDYICPMMCVPPVKQPGRCPVCAMELVPADSGGTSDGRTIVIDAATRRVANIETAKAVARPVTRTIRSVGELQFDEGGLRTITAYTAGRIEDLYVDYTGAVVRRGDRLATQYSPQLHTAAVEYLQALQSEQSRASATQLPAVADATRRLRANARQKLEELGLTEAQIRELEQTRQPASRIDISAPLAGTVIERMAEQGQTVRQGQPLFRLADLSSVWLILQLFPEDAQAVRYGLPVVARVKSTPGETFPGRIAFISPQVDSDTRTVQVRVVIDNSAGRLRIGDYAAAEVRVPVGVSPDAPVFDRELAGKWISPRHPHIISAQPGPCPQCGEPLVAAADLGFTATPPARHAAITVPRDAVLQAAGHSVVYVEEQPGRFALRQVVVGASAGADIVVQSGLEAGEIVATRGSFLLDSQMQLAGNPSLIDPERFVQPEQTAPLLDTKMLAAIERLPAAERQAAIDQKICPVTEFPLGSMGVPPKATIDGRAVYLCCEGCRKSLLRDPQSYLQRLPVSETDSDSDSESDTEPDTEPTASPDAAKTEDTRLLQPAESSDDNSVPLPEATSRGENSL